MKKFLLSTLILVLSQFIFADSLAPALAATPSQSSAISQSALLSDLNRDRRAHGLASLRLNTRLASAALNKGRDMVTADYWSHYSPSGKTPWQFIAASGYRYRAAGENLAYGFVSAADVDTAWMASPSHRANILGAKYRDVGFAVVHSSDFVGQGPQDIVVAEFGLSR